MFVLDFLEPILNVDLVKIFFILLFSEVTEGEAKPAEPEPVKHPEVDKAALKEQVKSFSVLRISQFLKLFYREGVTIPIFTPDSHWVNIIQKLIRKK